MGNVPLAAVLWRGGMSFGGVAAFIFGDLIILPILNIYRKYYGGRMTAFMAVTFYIAMVVSALLLELVLHGLNWVPSDEHAAMSNAGIRFNYTSVLDVIFGIVFIVLLGVFFRTGGPEMMTMMAGGRHHDHMGLHHQDHAHHHD